MDYLIVGCLVWMLTALTLLLGNLSAHAHLDKEREEAYRVLEAHHRLQNEYLSVISRSQGGLPDGYDDD
jgi:hypothetical protein